MYLMILDHLLESRMMLGGHTTGAQWQYYSIIISETSNFYSKLHSTKFSFTSWFGLEKMRNYSKPDNWPCYEYSWYRPQEKKSSVPNQKMTKLLEEKKITQNS